MTTAPRRCVFLKFLQNYRQHMVDPKGRLIPLVSCPGNHEVNGGYNGSRDKSPAYLSVFDGLFREKTYDVLDFGDYLSLVLLDTGHLAPIAGEQTAWLAKTLSERHDRPHLIVANHVPAYPSFRRQITTPTAARAMSSASSGRHSSRSLTSMSSWSTTITRSSARIRSKGATWTRTA